MKLQILGTGCPKCRKLAENAEKAVTELGISAEVEKVEDLQEIMKLGVMITPALAIDGRVVSSGKVLSAKEVKNHIGNRDGKST